MNAKIEISIDPYVNADGVRIYENFQQVLNETHEDRLSALKAVAVFIDDQLNQEFKRRQHAAGRSIVSEM